MNTTDKLTIEQIVNELKNDIESCGIDKNYYVRGYVLMRLVNEIQQNKSK